MGAEPGGAPLGPKAPLCVGGRGGESQALLEAQHVHPTRRLIEPLTGWMRMALLALLNIRLSAL